MDAARARLTRDAALDRIKRSRRWMIGGAAALTAALAGLASVLLPGKSLGSKSRSAVAASARTVASPRTATPRLPAAANAAQLGLRAPGQAPQAAPTPQPAQPQQAPQQSAPSAGGGAVVSGGS